MNYHKKEKDVESLIDCLKNKLKLLNELIKFSKQQTILIEDEDIDKLERLLESKGVRIDRIEVLDNEFIRTFTEIKQKYGVQELDELGVSKNLLSKLQDKTMEVNNTLEILYTLDKKNNNIIESRYNQLKGRIRSIKKGKNVRSRYDRNTAHSGGIYIDKKN